MQSMSQTVMGNVENFIIREKIGNASLSVAEVNAFYELADRGLAEFRLDAKDKSGFLISPLDVNVVENGFSRQAIEYNLAIKEIASRSGGLITETTPIKIVSGLEINSMLSLLPNKSEIRQSANQQLAEGSIRWQLYKDKSCAQKHKHFSTIKLNIIGLCLVLANSWLSTLMTCMQ